MNEEERLQVESSSRQQNLLVPKGNDSAPLMTIELGAEATQF
jgi:hypothetical protein